jgi:uncharacterized membrane-anchored protein YhcB (DUF1043 family)
MTAAWVSLGLVIGAIAAYVLFRFRSPRKPHNERYNIEIDSQTLDVETSRLYERELAAVRADEVLLDNIRRIEDPQQRLTALARFSAKRNPP